MKTLILAASASIALASFSGAATAGCTPAVSTPVNTVDALTSLLKGKTVCVRDRASADWKWQEYHETGGKLWDIKKGQNDPVDPSEPVGTWTVTGNPSGNRAQVIHDYGAGQRYPYSVFVNTDGTYSFCDGRQDIVATLQSGGLYVRCQ